MDDDPAELGRLVKILYEDLHDQGYTPAGVLHRVMRFLVTLAPAASSGCPVCGGPVVQPARGRARVYCSAQCRSRARNVRVMRQSSDHE
jgi:hypothetical protein